MEKIFNLRQVTVLHFLFFSKQKKKTENFKTDHQFNNLKTDEDPNLSLDVKLLYTMLNQLPDDQKECILLFEISGFSLKEIAAIQASSEGAIKQRLKRGREKLKELMEDVSLIKSDKL